MYLCVSEVVSQLCLCLHRYVKVSLCLPVCASRCVIFTYMYLSFWLLGTCVYHSVLRMAITKNSSSPTPTQPPYFSACPLQIRLTLPRMMTMSPAASALPDILSRFRFLEVYEEKRQRTFSNRVRRARSRNGRLNLSAVQCPLAQTRCNTSNSRTVHRFAVTQKPSLQPRYPTTDLPEVSSITQR